MTGASASPRQVLVFGAGNVGRALTTALNKDAITATLHAARAGWPSALAANVVVLACRDADIARHATAFATVSISAPVVLLHCAGALTAEALAGARRERVTVGQWHPLLSFSGGVVPSFAVACARVSGDETACVAARWLCERLNMRAVEGPLDERLYHAAAALLANGTAAVVDSAVRTLVAAGSDQQTALAMLVPLLQSVVNNVAAEGVPAALSGPVRRGATATVAGHLDVLEGELAPVRALYRALASAQLGMAAQIGDAQPADLLALEQLLRGA